MPLVSIKGIPKIVNVSSTIKPITKEIIQEVVRAYGKVNGIEFPEQKDEFLECIVDFNSQKSAMDFKRDADRGLIDFNGKQCQVALPIVPLKEEKQAAIVPLAAAQGEHKESDAQSLSTKRFNTFADNYDDSSDEDEIESSVSHYDIAQQWEQYKSDYALREEKPTRAPLGNDVLLSFVAHAAGLKCFYSADVRPYYHDAKHKHLGHEKNANVHSRLTVALISAVHEFLDDAALYMRGGLKTPDAISEFENGLKKVKEELSILIQKHMDVLVAWFSKDQSASRPLEIIRFQEEVDILLNKCFEKYFPQPYASYARSRAYLQKALSVVIKRIRGPIEIIEETNSAGKKKALAALDKSDEICICTLGWFKRKLDSVSSRSTVTKMCEHACKDCDKSEELFREFITDLKRLYLENPAHLGPELGHALQRYVLHSNSLLPILLDTLKSFQRPTLGKEFVFNCDNVCTFFSNLRLSNRSQKRRIKNSRFSLFKASCNDSVSRIWRFNKKGWARILEMQTILAGSLGRKDIVTELGDYETVHGIIMQIKEYFFNPTFGTPKKIEDRTIALWIREIFQGKEIPELAGDKYKREILTKLQAITYLLFGCEAVRNPAMHVINQMLLDLIINPATALSWKEALTGVGARAKPQLMPMSPDGSVGKARALSDYFNKYMPYNNYDYDGTPSGNHGELIDLEAEIIREWAKLKKYDVFDAHAINIPTGRFAFWLMQKIDNHLVEWFGDMRQQVESCSASSSSSSLSSSASSSC